ncbi:putative glutathione-specific gamma-glutamylcyclotransferase 2 [Toxorhynchites rutilus septentrionalis]|uniref:putative glutathione-specific gamma-glutamylcyclotransferase 2 n=1 Tax=Toxorhynchites rutilus septentrionalis TaxID=329112 RepID=UPI00247AFD14|nr:putative glutathione-specific gamma-glutamylcyclotransferase 2 [Toxorhynchites rutilus septentrionalis]
MNTTFESNGIASDGDLWIFGYGSLVWKADFPFEEKRTGYIKGFLRRFFQNSVDHRGTEEQPGRVVTLIRSQNPESKVWGMGYRIARHDSADVLRHLDDREKNGYDRHCVRFYPHSPSGTQTNDAKDIILYVASQENPSFAGQRGNLEEIAKQISTASGASGSNSEYVYKLADAMRQFYPGEQDEHLFQLEQIVKLIDKGDIQMHHTGIPLCDINHICHDG